MIKNGSVIEMPLCFWLFTCFQGCFYTTIFFAVQHHLSEVFRPMSMFQGNCAENTASKYKISRQEQDEYAIRSYKLSQAAAQDGVFQKEITPVEIPQKKGKLTKRQSNNQYYFNLALMIFSNRKEIVRNVHDCLVGYIYTQKKTHYRFTT